MGHIKPHLIAEGPQAALVAERFVTGESVAVSMMPPTRSPPINNVAPARTQKSAFPMSIAFFLLDVQPSHSILRLQACREAQIDWRLLGADRGLREADS